jgi:acyl-CoA synthetase (NDP forming)
VDGQPSPESSEVVAGYFDDELADRLSAVRPGLDAFLHPQAIAVVGASADPGTLSGMLFANLVASRFSGTVLPVNKNHPQVQGVPAYPDLASCPVVPDLVIVCVPAPAVVGVVAQAGELGIRAVCVISAGFAEIGSAGAGLQARLVEEAAARGVRVVGPNCTGVLSGTGSLRFNATFGRTVPRAGNTCMLSQSGAFGLAVLEAMEARGLGIGGFVSVGNTADVGVSDLLLYWGHDPGTDLVLLYLESVPDPRSFIRVAKHVGTRVPVVVLKAGRTQAGRRGAASHTAALSSGDVAVDAFLHQAGVIRAESIEEVLDLATVLGSQQRFRGRRVAIVTNGGGSGVIAADACESNGLLVPELGAATATILRSLLPAEASVSNPVDMIASATARHYGEVVRALGSSADIDALIIVFNTPVLATAAEVAAELVAARDDLSPDMPLVAVFLNRDGPPGVLREAGIPAFVFPENAARSLGRSVAWHERRGRSSATPSARPASGQTARRQVPGPVVRPFLAQAGQRARDGWLATTDAEVLLQAYGIAVPRSICVRTPGEAEAAQAKLGCPVVVKVAAAIHKSDVGGVRLGVTTPAAAAQAVRAVRADLRSAGLAELAGEILVQEQIDAGQEMIVGVNRDPLLGPLVVVGLGGRLVEVLGDVAVRVAPLSDDDVADMVQSLASYRLLTGYRGGPCLDLDALYEVLRGVSAIAEDHPEIAEMDLNPLFVLEKGAVAADVRARLSLSALS